MLFSDEVMCLTEFQKVVNADIQKWYTDEATLNDNVRNHGSDNKTADEMQCGEDAAKMEADENYINGMVGNDVTQLQAYAGSIPSDSLTHMVQYIQGWEYNVGPPADYRANTYDEVGECSEIHHDTVSSYYTQETPYWIPSKNYWASDSNDNSGNYGAPNLDTNPDHMKHNAEDVGWATLGVFGLIGRACTGNSMFITFLPLILQHNLHIMGYQSYSPLDNQGKIVTQDITDYSKNKTEIKPSNNKEIIITDE